MKLKSNESNIVSKTTAIDGEFHISMTFVAFSSSSEITLELSSHVGNTESHYMASYLINVVSNASCHITKLFALCPKETKTFSSLAVHSSTSHCCYFMSLTIVSDKYCRSIHSDTLTGEDGRWIVRKTLLEQQNKKLYYKRWKEIYFILKIYGETKGDVDGEVNEGAVKNDSKFFKRKTSFLFISESSEESDKLNVEVVSRGTKKVFPTLLDTKSSSSHTNPLPHPSMNNKQLSSESSPPLHLETMKKLRKTENKRLT